MWQAWADPDQVSQWWGPDHFTRRESVEVDLQPGGTFDVTMVESAGGAEYPVHFDVVEVSEPDLLVMSAPAIPEYGITKDVECRVEFREVEGGTEIDLVVGPYEGETRKMSGLGWGQQIGKLERLCTGAPVTPSS